MIFFLILLYRGCQAFCCGEALRAALLQQTNRGLLRFAAENLEYERDRLWDKYERSIEAAKTTGEKELLDFEQRTECREYDEVLLSMDSKGITRRGLQCHLSLYDIPLPEGETSHWQTGDYGGRHITDKTLREFTRAVEAAEYERAKRTGELRDFWLKRFTAVFAAAAAVASIINLFTSHNH